MNRYLFLIVSLVALQYNVAAQSGAFRVTDPDYDRKKAEGSIPSHAFISDTSVQNSVARVEPSVQPASSVLCQCMVPIDASFQVVPFNGGDPNDEYRQYSASVLILFLRADDVQFLHQQQRQHFIRRTLRNVHFQFVS